jgi:hypothetical protein
VHAPRLLLTFSGELQFHQTARSFRKAFFQTSCPSDDDKLSVILSPSLVTDSPINMAAFGWSAGDLVASIKIVIRIAGALKESGGAKADFQEATEFLFGLEITLHNLKSISPVLTIPSQEYTVQQEVKRISEPLKAFFTKVEKFDRCLGSGSKIGFFRTVPKKLQWAMGVSKEVISLRDRISIPMGSLGILLHTQNL